MVLSLLAFLSAAAAATPINIDPGTVKLVGGFAAGIIVFAIVAYAKSKADADPNPTEAAAWRAFATALESGDVLQAVAHAGVLWPTHPAFGPPPSPAAVARTATMPSSLADALNDMINRFEGKHTPLPPATPSAASSPSSSSSTAPTTNASSPTSSPTPNTTK